MGMPYSVKCPLCGDKIKSIVELTPGKDPDRNQLDGLMLALHICKDAKINDTIANLKQKIDVYELAIKWKYERLQTARSFPMMHKPMCQPNDGTMCSCGLDRWNADLNIPQQEWIKELTNPSPEKSNE